MCATANTSRDLLDKLDRWHRPSLGELKFRGLIIKEGWDMNLQYILLPSTMTALFLVVVAARFLFGDWSVAWTVGGVYLALVAVSIAWACYVAVG
jgi:hypothetical protein